MNSFNKTEAAVFSFRPCFLRATLSSVYYIINMLETIDCGFKCNADEFLKAPIVMLFQVFKDKVLFCQSSKTLQSHIV